jgi:hypothetical protein
MRQPSDERVRAFLALTLAQWGVDATVEAGAAPVVALLRFADGRVDIELERAPSADPFRWYVSRAAPSPGEPGSRVPARRPCGSLVGVLGAMRRTLNIESGGPARVVG